MTREEGTVRKLLCVCLFVGMISTTYDAEDSKPWKDRYCEGMERENRLPDGGRVDCLSATLAIEVEWARDWYHAVGQSLYYASATGRKPGIVLLCESSEVHVEGLCRHWGSGHAEEWAR